MRQHCDRRGFCLDIGDGGEFLHVSNAIHDRVDLPLEHVSVGQLALGATNLHLPAWIEEV
jgi:hypothetical protein